MEEKFVKEPVYETQRTGYKKVKHYVTEDGREFELKYDAEVWERTLEKRKSIAKVNSISTPDEAIDHGGSWSSWYLPTTKEEMEMILKYLGHDEGYADEYLNDKSIERKKLKIDTGDWIACEYVDNGDYKGDRYFYTLTYYKSKLKKILDYFDAECK